MRGVATIRGIAAVCAVAVLCGCASIVPRETPPNGLVAGSAIVPGMPTVRFWGDQIPTGNIVDEMRRRIPNLPRPSSYSLTPDGRPIIEYLALSGGGSDGAFGAGLLAGWSARGTRPQFEVVTGISAGAIIAPFAFLGPRYDKQLEQIWTAYETSEIITAQVLPGLLGGPALADTAPLAALIARYVNERFLRAIAAEYRRGRMLLIGTTNLDAQRPVIWNMGEIAASNHPDAIELFRKVIMASAAIPGAFPPVEITVEADGKTVQEMHVDGGVTREVFIAPVQIKLTDFDALYGGRKPVRRIYIVKNGKVLPEFEPVKATAIAIAARAITTLNKSQNYGAWRRTAMRSSIWRPCRPASAPSPRKRLILFISASSTRKASGSALKADTGITVRRSCDPVR